MIRLEPLVAGLPEAEAELVPAASALVPELFAQAAAADATRTLPEEVVASLRKAGLFRLATPRSLGGAQAGSRAVTAIAAEIARGCPSAAWVLTVFYSGGLATWLFPAAVRERIWSADPDATVCGSSGTGAPARPADGGYRISGRWSWSSGAHHADWIVLDIVGESAADRGLALVPLRDLTIEDTWRMTGMRGTGSDTVVADDVLVPADQVLLFSRMTAGELPRPQGLDSTLAGPLLGMGMAVYDLVAGTLSERRAASPAVQANVADAALLIDTAILHAARTAHAVDRGDRLTPVEEARVRMDGGVAARAIRAAVDKLLDVGGASRFADTDPAQRIWRDLNTAMRHPAYALETSRERYARLLLGR